MVGSIVLPNTGVAWYKLNTYTLEVSVYCGFALKICIILDRVHFDFFFVHQSLRFCY